MYLGSSLVLCTSHGGHLSQADRLVALWHLVVTFWDFDAIQEVQHKLLLAQALVSKRPP